MPRLQMVDIEGTAHSSRDLKITACGLESLKMEVIPDKVKVEITKKICIKCMQDYIEEYTNQ